jgi:hypothetical protein
MVDHVLHAPRATVARLIGRITHGLTPWRRSGAEAAVAARDRCSPLARNMAAPEAWVWELAAAIRERDVSAFCGGVFDEWDLEARAGRSGRRAILVAIEEHGQGRQLARVRAGARVASCRGDIAALLVAVSSRDSQAPSVACRR